MIPWFKSYAFTSKQYIRSLFNMNEETVEGIKENLTFKCSL
jgi:hypothetical protein